MFEELRQLAYGEPAQSKYEGVPELSPSEMEAFSKDTEDSQQRESWRKSVKFTDRIVRTTLRRIKCHY